VRDFLGAQLTNPASDSSIFGGYNLIAARMKLPVMADPTVNVLSAFLLGVLLLGIVWLALYAPRQPRVAALAFVAVAGVLVVGKTTEPWQAVWLVPLLALAMPRWRPALLWQAGIMVHFIALMLFESKVLGKLSDQHAIDTPYFVLAALLGGLGTCAMIGLVIRDMWHPEHDVVRRGGVDDPQGGVLLAREVPAAHG